MIAKRLRLLICPLCETVEPIEWCGEQVDAQGTPNFDCGHQQCEDALQARMIEHTVSQATGHYFHATLGLFDVAEKDWERLSTRKTILKNLTAPGEATPYGAELYALKDNFSADALKCWKQHGRTKNCGDWMSPAKRLVAPTRELRKDLGLETRDRKRPTATFICSYCPMASIIAQRQQAAAGQYEYTE